MRARSYVLSMVAVATALFVAVGAINLAIDPQGVFGTGLLRPTRNPNLRYLNVAAYQANPSAYDGLLFGSSRGGVIPLDELSRHMGGINFARFSVPLGLLPDHLPVLEYVLRDKATRGERLKAVFLLLDADVFGRQPMGNQSIYSYHHPVLAGESPGRFW